MNVRNLKDNFARIGARVMAEPARELWQAPNAARLQVCSDHRGQYFHLMFDPLRIKSFELQALRVEQRELELVIRQRAFGRLDEAPRQKFLCGRVGDALCVLEYIDAAQYQ